MFSVVCGSHICHLGSQRTQPSQEATWNQNMQPSMALARGAPICQVPPTSGGEHSGRTGDSSVEDSKPVFKEVMETEVSAPHLLAQGFSLHDRVKPCYK